MIGAESGSRHADRVPAYLDNLRAAGVSPDLIQQQAQAYLKPTNPDPATMSPQDAQ